MIWNTATTLALTLTLLGGTGALAQDDATAPEETAPAAPEATAPAAPEPPLWLMSCSNQAQPDELLCEFSQSIVLTQDNQSQRVATASFTRVAGGDQTNAAFALPFGVSLPDAVSVSVDETEVGTLAWQSCDGGGCYATGAVDQAWLDAMRTGETLTASLKARDGRDLEFAFQLKGLAAADDMLP